jgi:hypothetical protein
MLAAAATLNKGEPIIEFTQCLLTTLRRKK